MMEQEPYGYVEVGDVSMEVTRRSARLVHYLAMVAYDHIRVESDEALLYMFRSLMTDTEQFDVLEEFMVDSEMPVTMNEQIIGAEVLKAYEMTMQSMTHIESDYIPDDWLS